MKKDKKWLEEEVRKLKTFTVHSTVFSFLTSETVILSTVLDIIKQLDEPDADQAYKDGYNTGISHRRVEKPTIPQFVAEWIEELKQDERPLYSVMSSLLNKTNHEWAVWKNANKNFSEVVAQAWLDGYEVEKEPKYCVVLPEITGSDERYLVKGNDSGDLWIDGDLEYIKIAEGITYQFTEQEIKDYDPRYMNFAVKVEELEGCYKEQTDSK